MPRAILFFVRSEKKVFDGFPLHDSTQVARCENDKSHARCKICYKSLAIGL